MRRWRSEIVATAVVVVLAVVGVLALWPRGSGPAQPDSAAPTAAAQSADPAPDDDALDGLRRRAALQPCPGPVAGGGTSGPLAGVRVSCLGAPGELDLGAALAGRPALLNLWASWCGPCRAELPALAEYAGRPGAVVVLTVNVRDTPENGLALLADLGVRLPGVSDPAGDLRAALRAPPTLPVSYVLRPDGSVVRVDPPTPFRAADEVAAAVARYLAAPA